MKKLKRRNYTNWFTIKTTFEPVSSDFGGKQKTILLQAGQNSVQLLLLESDKIIAKIKIDIESNLKGKHQIGFWSEHRALEDKQKKYKKELEQKKRKKWQKLMEKYVSTLEYAIYMPLCIAFRLLPCCSSLMRINTHGKETFFEVRLFTPTDGMLAKTVP